MAKTFDDAKRDVLKFLIKIQNKEKGWWPSQFEGDKSSIWTTTHAIWALFECGMHPTEESITKALNYLVSSQNEKTGGWPERRFVYTIDSVVITADVVKVLSSISNMPEYRDAYNGGLSRLLQMQNEIDGGWGLAEGCTSIVRPTAVALASLCIIYTNDEKAQNKIRRNIERGANWIIQAQNKKDNGWGLLKNDNVSKNSTTAWAVWALSQVIKTKITVEGTTETLIHGCNWLVRHQDPNGSWTGDDEPTRPISENLQYPSIIGLDTPFMVMALCNSIKRINRGAFYIEVMSAIHKGIGRLIESQEKDGSWVLEWHRLHLDRHRGGRTWATAYYLIALNMYEKSCKHNLGEIIDELLRLYKTPGVVKKGQKFFKETSCPKVMTCGAPSNIQLYIGNYMDEKSQFLIKFEEHPEFIINPKDGFLRTLGVGDTDNLNFHITPKEGTKMRTLVVRSYRCLKTRDEIIEMKEFENIKILEPLGNKLKKYAWPIIIVLIGALAGVILTLLLK